MFLKNRQTKNTSSPQSTAVSTETQNAPSSIYTMPAKYIPPRRVQKGSSKTMWIVLILIVAILCIGGGIVAALYIKSQSAGVGPGVDINTNTNTSVNANNANRNTKKNENQNSNVGITLNFNVDPGLSNNINSGLFGNQNSNSNRNANTNTNAAAPDFSKIKDARDKDRDGLTDVEEDLYNTKFQLPDSDKDGYVDGTEVRGLFSPAEQNKTLLQSGLALDYTSADFGWSLIYPKEWIAEPLNNNPSEVIFTSDVEEGEFVEVIVTENTRKQSAAEWYASLYANVDPKDLDAITIGGLQGVSSRDGFVYYLANQKYIFTIVYQFGSKTEIHYRTTFEMMVKSFQYTAPVAQNTNTNSNANQNTNIAQ